MGGLASGGCDRPVRKRRRLHACPAGTEGPRRPSSLPTVRTDPMPGPPEERLHAGTGAPSGGCDRPRSGTAAAPCRPRRNRESTPALAAPNGPHRPDTGPTPALLPDDPAPPVRGTTPDARHSNTLPAPTTHRPEPSVRHPTAAPPGDAAHPLPRPAPDTPPQPVPGKLAAPHHREAIRAGRTGTHPSTCPAPART